MQRTDSLEKTLMLGKIEGRRRGRQRMRWLDGITDSMDKSLSQLWELVVLQGGLVCCSPWGWKEPDRIEWLNWTKLFLQKNSKILCASLEGIQSPASGLHCCFLTLPPLSPHPLPFLISNCLYLPFQTWASQVAQMVNCLPAMWETWVRSLGRKDPLEKEMATHSSTVAWEVPWTEEPGRLHSTGLQRVGQDWATSLSLSDLGRGTEKGFSVQKSHRVLLGPVASFLRAHRGVTALPCHALRCVSFAVLEASWLSLLILSSDRSGAHSLPSFCLLN